MRASHIGENAGGRFEGCILSSAMSEITSPVTVVGAGGIGCALGHALCAPASKSGSLKITLQSWSGDAELKARFAPVDLGGYYVPDKTMTEEAMRPSATFNAVIDRFGEAK